MFYTSSLLVELEDQFHQQIRDFPPVQEFIHAKNVGVEMRLPIQ